MVALTTHHHELATGTHESPPLSWTPSHLPPHPIPLGCSRAPALSALLHASSMHWSSVLHMVIHIFQCYSLKSPHPHLLLHRPVVCSLHLCLFCCLAYRIIFTVFLNSYICVNILYRCFSFWPTSLWPTSLQFHPLH